jgi:hypothetical protein
MADDYVPLRKLAKQAMADRGEMDVELVDGVLRDRNAGSGKKAFRVPCAFVIHHEGRATFDVAADDADHAQELVRTWLGSACTAELVRANDLGDFPEVTVDFPQPPTPAAAE